MKIIRTICLSFLLISCGHDDRRTDELAKRIAHLEHRMDSLVAGKNNPGGYQTGIGSYGTVSENGRCGAITKKGTQCKRGARSNGYCYQHGRQ